MELRKNSDLNANQDLSTEEKTQNEPKFISLNSKSPSTSLPALQRRFANDPRMMKELQRYQKIMLLTLLPSISSQQRLSINGQPSNNLEQQPQHPEVPSSITTAAAAAATTMKSNSRRSSLKDIKDSLIEIKGNLQDIKFPTKEKETTRLVSGWGNRSNACHSNFGLDQGSIVSLTSNATNNARISQPSGLRRRRKSKDGDIMTSLLSKSMNIDDFSQYGTDQNNGNLDLTTLTALYLESRQKIFGEEWTKRRDKEHHVSSKEPGEIGATGIIKPRRLLPLNSESMPATPLDLPPTMALSERRHSLVPTAAPSGLHLSARFNRSFNIDDPTLIRSRKGSHKARFRRLNSMDEFSLPIQEGEGSADEVQSHRPSSAPHIPKKDNINEDDTFSLPQETPARANTPTGARSSAQLIRPQLIGGSLVTYSPDQSLNISKKALVDSKSLHEQEHRQKNIIDDTLKSISTELNRPLRKSLPNKLSSNIQNVPQNLLSIPKQSTLSKPPGCLPKKGPRFKLSPLENLDKKHSVP